MDGLGLAGDAPEPWVLVRGGGLFDIVVTGVGKANAAGAIARVLDPSMHRGVLSVGVGGALPGSGLEIGEAVAASRSVFGDEGVGSESGLIPMDELGLGSFPDGSMGRDHDPWLVGRLASVCDRRGTIATVSCCSGTDVRAAALARETGAIAEAMEGAGVALAGARVRPVLPTGEVRVISNTTGDRGGQRWDLDAGLAGLASVLGRVAGALG